AAPMMQGGGAVTVVSDITDAKRTERALRLLAQAGGELAGSLHYRTVLITTARLATPHLADYCLVDEFNEKNEPSRVAVTHADPAREHAASELLSLPNWDLRLTAAILNGQSRLFQKPPDW